ncbi:hypothetical protein M0R04_07755 [Candidatus Dojkabacteria bacterium]|jgi:hypothetical protein|nr:hypothetical protein [Candidatus Dojkabacteria bacterium]
MMRSWCKILPFFFVEWYARKYGERFRTPYFNTQRTIVSPFKYSVFVFPPDDKDNNEIV